MKSIYVEITLQTPWKEGESRFDIQKPFIPVCDAIEASFVFKPFTVTKILFRMSS